MHPKNQHYVPRLLLKNFSSKERHIWAYDKDAAVKGWNVIKERPISKVASEDYFYDLVGNSPRDSYEYLLGAIEKEVTPVISKVLLNEDINIISESEKRIFAKFIAHQYMRTRSQRDNLFNLTEDLNERLSQFVS